MSSLNGEPEPGVVVEAISVSGDVKYQEESKTEQDGTYRIRGLQVRLFTIVFGNQFFQVYSPSLFLKMTFINVLIANHKITCNQHHNQKYQPQVILCLVFSFVCAKNKFIFSDTFNVQTILRLQLRP